MGIWLKNEKGVTLIELIITVAVIIIVLAVGYNFFSFALDSFSSQSDNVDNQFKARQVLRDMSGELRKVNSITIISEEFIQIGEVSYNFQKDNRTLLKNGEVFVTGIKSFRVEKDDNGRISLEITTLANNGREITLSSLISIRE